MQSNNPVFRRSEAFNGRPRTPTATRPTRATGPTYQGYGQPGYGQPGTEPGYGAPSRPPVAG